MTQAAPAVALLFDDTELGGQLRQALHERGARIVHEGGVSSLSRELLDRVGAEVLVVNLDDSADDALDQLYDVIDGDRPRVVFNDAQASRALAGWDRARWARHLAVKVMAAGDVDPPRPPDARAIEPSLAAAASEPVVEAAPAPAADMLSPAPDQTPAANEEMAMPADEAEAPGAAAHDHDHEDSVTAESDSLAAELEALLASGDLPADEEEGVGTGLRFSPDEELPPLHDGHFGVPEAAPGGEPAVVGGLDEMLASGTAHAPPPTAPAATFSLNHLQLAPAAGNGKPAPTVQAPAGWALLDDEAAASPPVADPVQEKPDPATFGIQKMSAADFLAQDVEQVATDLEPVMSLQLVSMEEAIAPQGYQPVHEMVLDISSTALSRIVLLGAAASGAPSVAEFLSALPAGTRLTFLLTQHMGDRSAEALVQELSARCALSVRLAEHGARAASGEVLVVPAGQQARVRRDGGIELQADAVDAAQSPSIDAGFTMAASAFGRDALGIVFAGRGTDAVAGAQAIHDRGGQVWVESSSGEHFADMVSGIFAERLVSFSGTPHELAAHLVEVFP